MPNMRKRKNKANGATHIVHQNGENHFYNHKLQNKDPTGQSEESCVSDQLSKFQLDQTINKARIFILPGGRRLEKQGHAER